MLLLPSDEELYDFADKIVRTVAPVYSEDCVQEVALALWKATLRFDPNKSSLNTYLWNIGKWAIKDYERAHHRHYRLNRNTQERYYVQQVELDEAWQGEVLDDDRSYGKEVIEAFNRETDRNRRILFEHYIEGKNAKEVGEEFGISESRVCQIVSRFRERFSVRESCKSSRRQPTACQFPKRPTRYLSPQRRSRPIVDTSFLSSVQETLPTR